MEFLAVALAIFLIVAYQSMSHDRELKQSKLEHEYSQFTAVDTLRQDGIITDYEHAELIKRLKENTQ